MGGQIIGGQIIIGGRINRGISRGKRQPDHIVLVRILQMLEGCCADNVVRWSSNLCEAADPFGRVADPAERCEHEPAGLRGDRCLTVFVMRLPRSGMPAMRKGLHTCLKDRATARIPSRISDRPAMT
jgi:hypothetical protein